MPRIYETPVRATLREAVAPTTIIQWNPVTDEGYIEFRMQELVTDKDTGDFIAIEPPLTGATTLSMTIAELIAMETIPTAVGDASGLQLMLAVKSVFATRWDQENPA